jgi:GNAT superfamily N-acetyltransferase
MLNKSLFYFNKFLGYENIQIMRKNVECIVNHNFFEVNQYTSFSHNIKDFYQKFHRNFSNERLRKRFYNGLKFYTLKFEKTVIASTWIISSNCRFIDECALSFPIKKNHIWIRDIFVHESMRGQGIFGRFIDNLIHEYYHSTEVIWSDLNRLNKFSITAHKKYGFKRYDNIIILNIFNKYLFRISSVRLRT